MPQKCLLYDDYIKLRDAKVGETVIFKDGSEITKTRAMLDTSSHKSKPTKNMGLDFYDRNFEG